MAVVPEATGNNICLAYAGSYDDHLEVLPLLNRLNIRATFFVAPELAIGRAKDWIAVQELGHELGNGTLCHVTDDGQVLNWRRETLLDDLMETNRLIEAWGSESITAVFLPGVYLEDAEGNYFDDVATRFQVVIGERTSLNGNRGRLVSIPLKENAEAEIDGARSQGKIPVLLVDHSLKKERALHDRLLIALAADAHFATVQEIRFL